MFITFEGIEGAGKGTMLKMCAQWLSSVGVEPVTTREPGGTELGAALRTLLLAVDSPVRATAEMFLYLADRAQHVAECIRPALDAGRIVLCDRYADSNIIYQGVARGLGAERLLSLNDVAVDGVWPDVTLLFDLDARVGLMRAQERNKAQNMVNQEGRFEQETIEFHERVRAGFLQWAKEHPARIITIDASGEPNTVFQKVRTVLESHAKMQFFLLRSVLQEVRQQHATRKK